MLVLTSPARRSWAATLMGIAAVAIHACADRTGAQEVTTQYSYDVVGNRLSVTNQIVGTAAAVFSFDPGVGLPGDRVLLFGQDLPAGHPEQLNVTFDGIGTQVLSVSTTTATVEVPQGARTGEVAVAFPPDPPTTVGLFHVAGVVIEPLRPLVSFDQTVTFSAEVIGITDPGVSWEVVPPGDAEPNASAGTIDPVGSYVPPAKDDVDAIPELFITAHSVELPFLSARTRVRLFGTAVWNPGATGPRVSLPATGNTGGLEPGDTFPARSATPRIILGATGDFGDLPLNANVPWYGPAVSIVLPADTEAPGTGLHNVVHPAYHGPIRWILPVEGDTGGLPEGVTTASPAEIEVRIVKPP